MDTPYKKIDLTKGKYALVNNEDFEWLNQWKWYCNVDQRGNKKVARWEGPKKNRKFVLMHRQIMGVLNSPSKVKVDHINRNQLDNRRVNLRICSNAENSRNCVRHRDNHSGYKGVTWHKRSQKWYVQIVKNYRHIFLGMYDDKRKAAHAYNQAAQQYFGEFARLNIL